MAKTALDPKGLKRVCVGCGIRFYDFNKRPISCPQCGAEFSGEIKLKGRRGRSAAAAEPVKDQVEDKNVEEIEKDDDVVSLEDVKDMEDGGDDEDMELADEDLGDLEDIDVLEENEDSEEEIEVDVDKED